MNKSSDVFEGVPLLSCLPDETLFSLASRHHYFWGHPLASSTNSVLFGYAHGGTQHDLPSCIDEFVTRTEQRFGTAEEVCTFRTLLRYYRKFMDVDDEERAIAALRGPTVANLKFRMGLLTSRFRANHPLKACLACMEADRHSTGWAYWHLEHQYPGVCVCQKHRCLLHESNLKASGAERFLWHLPEEAHFRLPQIKLNFDNVAFDILSRISKLSNELIRDQSVCRIDMAQLHSLYRAELGLRNLLSVRGGFRLFEIAKEFEAHVRPLRQLPEFAALPATVDEAYRQLSRYLRIPRTGTHPLRHIVIIEWLFGDCERFLKRYTEILAAPIPSLGPKIVSEGDVPFSPHENDKKQTLARIIQEGGSSVRAAATELGIDTSTALAWAAQMGVEVLRRPKKLKHEIREALVARLREGGDKSAAATEFTISVITVTHVLRTEIGLHVLWKTARQQSARNTARTSWMKLTSTYAHLSVKLLRLMDPPAYAWLYRNDRIWLSEHLPARKGCAHQAVASVRWEVRDAELSAAVERAALKLDSSLGKRKLMLWHLYQEIPELKAKLSALSHLPLTVRAIEYALHRRVLVSGQALLDF